MRKPTPHRIRQELIEAEVEYEEGDETPGLAFLAAIVCDRLGIDPDDVFDALTEENGPPPISAPAKVIRLH